MVSLSVEYWGMIRNDFQIRYRHVDLKYLPEMQNALIDYPMPLMYVLSSLLIFVNNLLAGKRMLRSTVILVLETSEYFMIVVELYISQCILLCIGSN